MPRSEDIGYVTVILRMLILVSENDQFGEHIIEDDDEDADRSAFL